MRDKIQKIVVQATAGTKDITDAIDELLILCGVVDTLCDYCDIKKADNLVCNDCLDTKVREGA